MPDVSGMAGLDVAIGLIVVFIVLSVVCSAINEAIAGWFNLRGRNLEKGIRSLLVDPQDLKNFYADPRVKALMKPKRPGSKRQRRPSYIPPRIFALTILDILAPPASRDGQHDLVARAEAAIANRRAAPIGRTKLMDTPIGTALSDAVVHAGGSRDELRASLERSFDEVMERAGGWYRRRIQKILLVIAVVLVGATNADAFTIADRLWKDDALRTAIVAVATDRSTPYTCADAQDTKGELAQAAACLDGVDQLGIPLGWTDATTPDGDVVGILAKLLGLMLTVAAVSLGAPFWFDLLARVSNLRATGKPLEPGTAGAAAQPGSAGAAGAAAQPTTPGAAIEQSTRKS